MNKKNTVASVLLSIALIATPLFSVYADDPVVTPSETILIRNGSTVVWQGSIDLPAAGTVDIPDKAGVTHTINADSVLAVLYAADQSTDAFDITDLEYYSSFGSFYLKCITPKGEAEVCDNWQYAVGDTTPGTGMDATILSGGESLGFYYGNQHKVTLDKNAMYAGDSVVATASRYKYEDDTWLPLDGVTIGATVPNPSDPWNPTEVLTVPVDIIGVATLTLPTAATYTIGIKEDYYFPSYTLVVNPLGGGGGGSTMTTLSVPQAVLYLTSTQHSDGSFGDMLYTDWAAIALSPANAQAQAAKQNVTNYLLGTPLISSLVTDNERHAMALMALGINPYTGTSTNYIAKIVESFDGNQLGDTSLINDDIFGLITLKNAGYVSLDDIITKDVEYVIAHQAADGSWGGVDMTAAGILALRNFIDISGVQSSLSKAESYLTNTQGSNGGFGNSFATSWVLQALSSNSSLASFVSKADTYLSKNQQTDGGLELATNPLENRIWSTSYAIPAALHMPWNTVMQSFSKQTTSTGGGTGSFSGATTKTPAPTPLVPEVKKDEKLEVVKEKVIDDTTPIKIQTPKTKTKKIKAKTPKLVTIPQLVPVVQAAEDTSALGASAVDREETHGLPYRVIHAISSAVISPFTWLWGKLGF